MLWMDTRVDRILWGQRIRQFLSRYLTPLRDDIRPGTSVEERTVRIAQTTLKHKKISWYMKIRVRSKKFFRNRIP